MSSAGLIRNRFADRVFSPPMQVAAICLVASVANTWLTHMPAAVVGLLMSTSVVYAVYRACRSQAIATRELRTALYNLETSETRFRSAFDDAPIGVALVLPDGRLMRVNRALREMLGYSEGELLSRSFQDITHPDDRDADLAQIKAMLKGTIATYEMEKRYVAKAGGELWALLSVSLVRDDRGEPLYFIAQIQDVSARKQLEEELRHIARHDRLTGLPTRGVLHEHLEQCFRRAQRWRDYHFGVLFLDLDGFKQVNDTLGHEAGDEVLQQVAHRLQSSLRASDSVARGTHPLASRMGGDEFVVLLDRLADPADAHQLAERLSAALAKPYVISAGTANCSASVGVAVSSGGHSDAGEMLRAADASMYHVKRETRDAA